MKKVLVVDDEVLLIKGLKFSLEDEGFLVDAAYDGKEALEKFKSGDFDLIILDLMLPEMDGMEVCKRIRETSDVPIIILSAKGEDTSKILGLVEGADDYLTKPFNTMELIARINAIFRRFEHKSSVIEFDGFKLNTIGRRIEVDGENLNLTAKEFDLLLLLIQNKEKVFSREELLKEIWGYNFYGDIRTVDVHIRRLREKIEKVSSRPNYIMTKWGDGYYFKG